MEKKKTKVKAEAEVKTNIGLFESGQEIFSQKQHGYKKIFNTNTIKLSDSCTPNVKNLIKQQQQYYEEW